MSELPSHQALYQKAKDLELSEPELALSVYLSLQKKAPQWPNLNFRLGLLYYAQADFLLAEIAFLKELEVHPDFFGCWHNLGRTYLKLKKYAFAEQAFQDALKYSPLEARQTITYSWVESLLAQGQSQAALAALHPFQSPQRDWLSAQAYKQLGQIEQALFFFQRALDSGQFPPEAYLEQGIFLGQYNQHLKAEQSFLQVISHPEVTSYQKSIAYLQLAHSQSEQGLADKGLLSLGKAIEISPEGGFALAEICLLPSVYESMNDLHKWRKNCTRLLDAARVSHFKIQNHLSEMGATPFYLAYQGFNEKEHFEKWSDILKQTLPDIQIESHARFSSAHKKPLLGVLSAFLYEHSIIHTFQKTLETLSQHFEIHFISPRVFIEDQMTQILKELGHWHVFEGTLTSQVQSISRLNLDLMVYLELGIDLNTYLLAHYSLARLQCVLPGHPITSGISSLDYFISSSAYEIPEAASHYVEPLALLEKGFTTYIRPECPRRFKSKSQLGLPDLNIYFCPMSLYKIHPTFDAVLRGILSKDPEGVIVCLKRGLNDGASVLQKRFQNTLSPFEKRVIFLPWFSPHDFMHVLGQVEVVLETFPFGSYNTLFKAFAMGTPVVIKETEFLRGRFGVEMYQNMGLSHYLTNSIESYISQAIKWGTDPVKRAEARADILKKNACLFEQEAGRVELVNFLLRICSENGAFG